MIKTSSTFINSIPKESHLILYDQECPMCTLLAQFMKKSLPTHLQFISWQEFVLQNHELIKTWNINPQNKVLRIWNGNEFFEEAQAWSYLIEHHPTLSQLNWLATKLNLINEISTSLNWLGKTAKKICFRCRNKF